MPIRCVVTGHDAQSKAVFVSDEVAKTRPLTVFDPFEFTKLWSGDAVPGFPNDGGQPGGRSFFPPPGGVRFFKMTVPPPSGLSLRPEQRAVGFAEMEEIVPGLAPYMERANPGTHTSDSIDFGYVISGEIWLELDGGVQKLLRAGDTFVQSATRHAWRNKSSSPCSILFVIVGALREPTGLSLVNRDADTSQGEGARGA